MASSKFETLHKAFVLLHQQQEEDGIHIRAGWEVAARALSRELYIHGQQGLITKLNFGVSGILEDWCKENNRKLFSINSRDIPTLDELEDCVLLWPAALYFTNKKTAIWYKLTH